MTSELSIEDVTVWCGPVPGPHRVSLMIQDGVVAALMAGAAPQGRERRSLAGAHILPGFVDAHSHLTVSAWLPHVLDAAAWGDAAAALAAIARHRASRPEGGWIVALGADFDRWALPRPDDLDAAAGGHPMVIADFSLHRCLASSEARRLGGIARGTGRDDDIVTAR